MVLPILSLNAEPRRADLDAATPVPVVRTMGVAAIVTRRSIVAPTSRVAMIMASAMHTVPFVVLDLQSFSRHDRLELHQRGRARRCRRECGRQDRYDGCRHESFKHKQFSFVRRLMMSDTSRRFSRCGLMVSAAGFAGGRSEPSRASYEVR